MIDLATTFLGPLAIPECRRAARRPWPIVARSVAGILASIAAFVTIWAWWIASQVDPTHMPFVELRVCLVALVGIAVAAGLLLAPAYLAGSLAGEKERGSIGLLLATDASARDIVLGRLAGGLGQILMIELATIPLLVGIASLAGFGVAGQATMMALPLAVAFGAGGISLGASALSRRGRDALMLVYLIIALSQFAPLLGVVGVVNPFANLAALVWGESIESTWICIAVWLGAGIVGLGLAVWRLRPSALSEGKGDRARRQARRRGRRVPDVDENRPMAWKERYIERAGNLGNIGRWIGGAIVVWLVGGSLILGGIVAWRAFQSRGNIDKAQWAVDVFASWFAGPAETVVVLVWVAIGLRAAVTIASERERGTWDGLLTSPLEGGEIVVGKLLGSLRAVRWLAGAVILTGLVALVLGINSVWDSGESLFDMATLSVFMAALGVRVSLHSATATRAMGLTLGIGLVAVILVTMAAATVCLVVAVLCGLSWLIAGQLGFIDLNTTPAWFPMRFETGFAVARSVCYATAAFALVAETRLRFDRVAGRMTAGKASVAVDRFIHGGPVRPVSMAQANGGEVVFLAPVAASAGVDDQAM